MQLSFCEKYGLNKNRRNNRLSALGLGRDENILSEQLQRHVLQRHSERLVEQFFRILRLDNEANDVFVRGFRESKLQSFLVNYLHTLGVMFDQPKYFEQRLRMGIAHINAGIRFTMFQFAYRILQQLILDEIPREAKNYELIRAFTIKITTLDLVIATEAYDNYQMRRIDKLIKRDSDKNLRGSVQNSLDQEQMAELMATGLQLDGEPGCLSVACLDEVDKIEQVYGQETLDQVRKGVALRLMATLRPGDGVGVLPENCFMFVLSHASLVHAEDICYRLMNVVAEHPLAADNITIPVTISMVLVSAGSESEHKNSMARLTDNLALIQSRSVNHLEILNGGVGS